jgi:acetyltransferase-like isoleucine patch superfamily enzyme
MIIFSFISRWVRPCIESLPIPKIFVYIFPFGPTREDETYERKEKAMYFRHNLTTFLETSWIKTLYFNLRYFGWKGFSLPVIVGKKFKLKKMKGTVILPESLPKKIFLGRDDFGWMRSHGYWCNEGTVIFEGSCFIGNGTRLTVSQEGTLIMGGNLYFSGNALVICRHAIRLGGDSMISWNVTIMDSDLHAITDRESRTVNSPKAVLLGKHTWIGFESRLLKGCQLPDGCIVAAGSTVSKAFDRENLLIGKVNEILKNKVEWEA